MFGLFFTEAKTVTCFADVQNCNFERFKKFFHAILEAGIYFPPSAYEVCFVSACHKQTEISNTLKVFDQVFSKIR